jgi:periplasmic divalent cation tolerance protein
VTELCEVVITAPDPAWLRSFTRELVDRRLCSSVHNFAPVHSIYRWQGEVHERTEGRASLHTRRALVPEIVQYAKERHPYQVPGISARPIYDGNPEYLDWIAAETHRSTSTGDADES